MPAPLAASPPIADGAQQRRPSPVHALSASLLGFFVITLDASVVNFALPDIHDDLGGGPDDHDEPFHLPHRHYKIGETPMPTWTSDELDRIAGADELEIAPLRRDGTLRGPGPIWVVRDGNDLYVRSFRGTDGGWWRTARAGRRGHISSGGVD